MSDRIAHRLRNRLRALAWLARVDAEYPGGVVPITTAARVLGCRRQNVERLIADGKLRLVHGMPGGGPRDKFVPVADLYTAPTGLEAGRAWSREIGTGALVREPTSPEICTKPAFAPLDMGHRCRNCERRDRKRKLRHTKDLA